LKLLRTGSELWASERHLIAALVPPAVRDPVVEIRILPALRSIGIAMADTEDPNWG